MQASIEQNERQSGTQERRGRAGESVERAYKFSDLSAYPLKKRLLIRAADLAFYLLINFIGRTARFEVEGWEHHEQITGQGRLPIYNFWHSTLR